MGSLLPSFQQDEPREEKAAPKKIDLCCVLVAKMKEGKVLYLLVVVSSSTSYPLRRNCALKLTSEKQAFYRGVFQDVALRGPPFRFLDLEKLGSAPSLLLSGILTAHNSVSIPANSHGGPSKVLLQGGGVGQA